MSDFDFGKVCKQLESLGIDHFAWSGEGLILTIPEVKVHIDVYNSLEKSGVGPFTLEFIKT